VKRTSALQPRTNTLRTKPSPIATQDCGFCLGGSLKAKTGIYFDVFHWSLISFTPFSKSLPCSPSLPCHSAHSWRQSCSIIMPLPRKIELSLLLAHFSLFPVVPHIFFPLFMSGLTPPLHKLPPTEASSPSPLCTFHPDGSSISIPIFLSIPPSLLSFLLLPPASLLLPPPPPQRRQCWRGPWART
jgi:hypothetical protein